MSVRSDPLDGLTILREIGMERPWLGYVEPVQILGNLYFVGTSPASSHIIDTGDGLLMIDTGLPQSCYLILDGIYRLGFKPQDLRWIVHSHGHYDHIGSTRALVELTGAQTYISRPDAPIATGEQDLSWATEIGAAFRETFQPDVLIDDGDVFHFGNTTMTCLLTPGHSLGSLTLLWNVEGAGRPLTAGMYGGTGLNTLLADWLTAHGFPLTLRDQFRESLRRAAGLSVDVMIGNHIGHNHMLDKLAQRKADPAADPFVCPGEWQAFLAQAEAALDGLLAEERAESAARS